MDILQLIDRLEELFNDAKALPFTHNVVVDEDKMLELIDQMRIAIPEEVKKAQQVMAQRDRDRPQDHRKCPADVCRVMSDEQFYWLKNVKQLSIG